MDIFLDDRFIIDYRDVHRDMIAHFKSPLREVLLDALNDDRCPSIEKRYYTSSLVKDLLNIDDITFSKLLENFSNSPFDAIVYYQHNKYSIHKNDATIVVDNLNDLCYNMVKMDIKRFVLGQDSSCSLLSMTWHCELKRL